MYYTAPYTEILQQIKSACPYHSSLHVLHCPAHWNLQQTKSSCLYHSSLQLLYIHCIKGKPPSLCMTVQIKPELGIVKHMGKMWWCRITWPICHSLGGFHWHWWHRPPCCAWTHSRPASALAEYTHSGCPPEGEYEREQIVMGKVYTLFLFIYVSHR